MLEKIYLNEIDSVPESYRDKTVAAHLHAFYIDELSIYAEHLNYIPKSFDLFISVPQGINNSEEEIKDKFKECTNLRNVVLARTPNRGRDIAPMLCTFKEQLMKYDIILHLHTKKSVHNECLKNWGRYLLGHVLPDVSGVSKILTLLSDNYFLIASNELITDLTGWGEHDCNLSVAQSLIDRSVIDIELAKVYSKVSYPQGSFFWMRKESLVPLFEIGLDYEDFPKEPIPPDGTIAHAIERLFGVFGWEMENAKKKKLLAGKVVFLNEEIVNEYLMSELKELSRLRKKNELHVRKMQYFIMLSIVLFLILLVDIICRLI